MNKVVKILMERDNMSELETENLKEVYVACRYCGKKIPLKLHSEGIVEFSSPNRRHVQDIFPYLTNDERELLISGTCKECWDKMFSFPEDEEEE